MNACSRVALATLQDRVAAALRKAGVTETIAIIEAAIMAEADLQEVPSHGVRMLPPLLKALGEQSVNPRPQIRLLREFGATVLIDGDNGPGRHLACHAMDAAMVRARQYGVGLALANRSTHWGRAHAYAARAAQAGFVGLCTTNAIPTMAAWGARQRMIGNNPLAIGVPRGEKEDPVVLDIAMSQAAVGKVATWQREGREVPEGWGLDAAGNPSRDAAAILGGAVLPFGGHKGAGLALMMELLTAGLGAGHFGNEVAIADASGIDPESSKLFIAIDPDALGGRARCAERVAEYLGFLDTAASSENEHFQWPGQRGWQARERNLRNGVPLHADIVAALAYAGVHFDE